MFHSISNEPRIIKVENRTVPFSQSIYFITILAFLFIFGWSESPFCDSETEAKKVLTQQTPPTESKDFIQYKDDEYHYSISYPSSWSIIPNNLTETLKQQLPEGRQLLLAVWSSDQKLNMIITIEGISEGSTLDEIIAMDRADSPFSSNNISQEEIAISNIRAVKSVDTATTPGGKPSKFVHLFLLHDNYFWNIGIGGHPELFDASRKEIDIMINSMQILEK